MLQTLAAKAKIAGIGHVVLHVADVPMAAAFYREVLGLNPCADVCPCSGDSLALATASGDKVVLTARQPRIDADVSAVHVGYAVSLVALDRAVSAVATRGAEVYRYREDRPTEAANNVYFFDPSGNRIQLVKNKVARGDGADRIDHVAVEVSDILWTELMFGELLGCQAAYRVGWTTEDYLKAKSAGETGMRDALPGSRYWNQRYSPFETERRTLRPCPQLYYSVGEATLVFYLAARHFQAAPDDIVVGTARVGIATDENGLDILADLLRKREYTFQGPVRHDGPPTTASVYLRDRSGNYFEFFAPVPPV